jgi:hypothetical protein
MCLALSICLLDVDFFDEGTTANNLAQIQNQYLLPMSLEIAFRNWPCKISQNRFIDAD